MSTDSQPTDVSPGGGTAPPRLSPPSLPDYELLRLIGRGSYGEVWLARGVTGIYRAIKIVRRASFSEAGPFEREFKGLKEFAAISLGESIQLALLHIGRNDEAGFFYYVMELADDAARGRDIDPATYVPLTLTELRRRRGRVPAADCVAYGVELARVLAGLHSRGLVHRDIKPSNVILVNGGAKVADIGLVTNVAEARTYIGTEGFVPPEGPGAPAGDVFALGKLLYELSTGLDREEFPRLPPELEKIPDRKRLLALNKIVLRACEPDVKQRYRDGAAMLADLQRLQAGGAVRFKRAWGAAAGLLLLMGAGLWWRAHSGPPTVPGELAATAVAAKSIAVLPFENLSDDKENAFLADGIHEEILTNLANIASLRVISRTSVMQYRGTTKAIGQIARELGVGYVLEGSVRRVGQRVRVTGQLIRAAADQDVWAKTYDGDMGDILTLQAQVATAIAEQLKAVLTPEEARRLKAVTLADPAAYELYLRGKELRRREMELTVPDPAAEAMFKQATVLDPKFALPWVELARIHVAHYFNNRDLLSEREQAKEALDHAVALAPDRAEVEAGLGEYYYYGFEDFASAASHYQKALALEPSDAGIHYLLGLLARRQGRWRESINQLRLAHELDPFNRPYAILLRTSYSFVHDFSEALALTRTILQSEPDDLKLKTDTAYFTANQLLSRRPIDEWYAALTPAQRQSKEAKETWRWFTFDSGKAKEYLELVASDAPTAAQLDAEDEWLNVAMAQRVLGRDATAALAEMRTELEARTRTDPRHGLAWAELALVYALQGDRTRAESALKQSVEFSTNREDVLNQIPPAVMRAKALAWLGDKDAAVEMLSQLLRHPGPEMHPYRLMFSLEWWPLRGHPRFEALLADPATFHPAY